MTPEMIRATTLGVLSTLALVSEKKFDQQKLPNVYIIGPKNINWYMAVLMELLPGVGRLHLLNK